MLHEIISSIRSEVAKFKIELIFLLAVNNENGDNSPKSQIERFCGENKDCKMYVVPDSGHGITDAGAGRYIYGFYEASLLGDIVIDIDSAGAHDPKVIGGHISALLQGKQAVFSTRFGMKGAKDTYPLMRRLASIGTTVVSNLILWAGRYFPDMASGYQGFQADLLQKVFKIVQPSHWITFKTTTAFIETELRSYVVWLLQQEGNNINECIEVLPIEYGVNKKGVNFPAKVGLKALKGFYLLLRRKKAYKALCTVQPGNK